MTKPELRKYVRSLKKGYTQEQLMAMSEDISASLLAEQHVREANCILAYFPLPDEVSVITVIEALVSQGKTVLLPEVVSDTEMVLREYHSRSDLKEGAFGIMEPTGKLFDDYNRIETVLVPGMAFDEKGNRLGRGKGYYDRFFADVEARVGRLPYLIGVAFPFQKFGEIPHSEHDKMMDKVLTL